MTRQPATMRSPGPAPLIPRTSGRRRRARPRKYRPTPTAQQASGRQDDSGPSTSAARWPFWSWAPTSPHGKTARSRVRLARAELNRRPSPLARLAQTPGGAGPGPCPAHAARARPAAAARTAMEAVPLTLAVEGDEEEVVACQRLEHRRRMLPLQRRITQGPRQPVEDGRAQHQRLHRRIMRLEHLCLQEVDQMAGQDAQFVHEGAGVGSPPQRERRSPPGTAPRPGIP